jgi:hypothetical protein
MADMILHSVHPHSASWRQRPGCQGPAPRCRDTRTCRSAFGGRPDRTDPELTQWPTQRSPASISVPAHPRAPSTTIAMTAMLRCTTPSRKQSLRSSPNHHRGTRSARSRACDEPATRSNTTTSQPSPPTTSTPAPRQCAPCSQWPRRSRQCSPSSPTEFQGVASRPGGPVRPACALPLEPRTTTSLLWCRVATCRAGLAGSSRVAAAALVPHRIRPLAVMITVMILVLPTTGMLKAPES